MEGNHLSVFVIINIIGRVNNNDSVYNDDRLKLST